MSVFYKHLEILKNTQELAFFRRGTLDSKDNVEGFVKDFNGEWLLLDVVISETGKYGGIRILQMDEITQVRWDSQALKTLKLLVQDNYKPADKGMIDITNINLMLTSVQNEYGYVNLFFEKSHPDACYIGKIVDMDEYGVLLEEYPTHSSTVISRSLFMTKDITRVDAGAPYEENINLIARKHRVR